MAPLPRLPFRRLHSRSLHLALRAFINSSSGSSHPSPHHCSLGGLDKDYSSLAGPDKDYLHQVPQWSWSTLQPFAEYTPRRSLHFLSSWSGHILSRGVAPSLALRWREAGVSFRSMSTKSRVENRKKKDLAQREFKSLRRRTKMMKERMTEEERLLWRHTKAKRKQAMFEQRLKKYELEEDPEPIHDPELITPEQLQALKKIGYKNRNYVPVGRRGVYGGVVQNMHMHWKKHETVQVDCHIFKRPEIRPMARELAKLSGGIVIDIHQGTTIIMFRGRNYKQPKGEMIPLNTLSKRKALFKSKFLQALEGINKNIQNIEYELRTLRRKQNVGDATRVVPGGVQTATDVTKYEEEAGRSDNTIGREMHSQTEEQTPGEECEGTAAADELSEGWSDEDDANFNWDSDSVDEDDLSDCTELTTKSQLEDKKAECCQGSDMKALSPEGNTGIRSSQYEGKVNEDDNKLALEKDTNNATDGTIGNMKYQDSGRRQSLSQALGEVAGQREDLGKKRNQRGLQMTEENSLQNAGDMAYFGNEIDEKVEGPVSSKRNGRELQKSTQEGAFHGKGQGLNLDAQENALDSFEDNDWDDSDDMESGLLRGYTDDDFEETVSPGTSSADGQMSQKSGEKSSPGKRQQQLRMHSGKDAEFDQCNEVLDDFSGGEEYWEGDEFEGELDDFDGRAAQTNQHRSAAMQGKSARGSRDDWSDDDFDVDGQPGQKFTSNPSSGNGLGRRR